MEIAKMMGIELREEITKERINNFWDMGDDLNLQVDQDTIRYYLKDLYPPIYKIEDEAKFISFFGLKDYEFLPNKMKEDYRITLEKGSTLFYVYYESPTEMLNEKKRIEIREDYDRSLEKLIQGYRLKINFAPDKTEREGRSRMKDVMNKTVETIYKKNKEDSLGERLLEELVKKVMNEMKQE